MINNPLVSRLRTREPDSPPQLLKAKPPLAYRYESGRTRWGGGGKPPLKWIWTLSRVAHSNTSHLYSQNLSCIFNLPLWMPYCWKSKSGASKVHEHSIILQYEHSVLFRWERRDHGKHTRGKGKYNQHSWAKVWLKFQRRSHRPTLRSVQVSRAPENQLSVCIRSHLMNSCTIWHAHCHPNLPLK